MKHKVYCNDECLYINGEFVTDCYEPLASTFSSIASALEVDYEYVEEFEELE